MALDKPWLALWTFIRTRYGFRFSSREELAAYQKKKITLYLSALCLEQPDFAKYQNQGLPAWPLMSKSNMIQNFKRYNRLGINYKAAVHAAQSEGRLGDITAGLSSGTSGRTGVFLADGTDRSRWAGVLLARVLNAGLLRSLLCRRPPLRVAFFLRANSHLYSQVGGSRIHFQFFDLFRSPDELLQELVQLKPELLIAPAQVLLWLARSTQSRQIGLQLRKVISVAEVLEPDAKAIIESAWDLPVSNLYQATEGFFAYTCRMGNMHLNEEFVHVEPEWLDAQKQRFVPVITDFTRQTQYLIRYRLDDVLVTTHRACACGKHTLVIDTIEGRCDDVLWARDSKTGEWKSVFAEVLRKICTTLQGEDALTDYRVVQHADLWVVSLAPNGSSHQAAWLMAIQCALQTLGLESPNIEFKPINSVPFHVKNRRIQCVHKPTSSR